MGFTIEQTCPQCGGPIEIDETDHLLRCPYCDVRNYLFAPTYFRYELPHKAPKKELIYAPYLRFRGSVYFCKDMDIGHRLVDITAMGSDFKGIPVSLGIRPQAMKMKFVTPETTGSFLRFTRKASDILANAGRLSSGSNNGDILHRAFIGETMSLIYLPLYIENNRLYDAVLNKPIANFSGGVENLEQAINRSPKWGLTFIPTLCPDCGWELEGDAGSVVLTCSNCDSAWEAVKGKFKKIDFNLVPGEDKETIYLPFWKTTVVTRGVDISSFADFIRLTNQPRVVGKDWEEKPMSFWSPAFKIRPKVFLRLSKQFTISQQQFETEDLIPKKNLFPVTLPCTEAVQSMKMILAASAVFKKNIFPHLPHIRFDVKKATLVFLPFSDTGHEMKQQHIEISINKNTLDFGLKL